MRAAEGRRVPWKNGGGETVEIATHPPGAGLDSFDWRVSVALVAADGPFSAFPGVDRILAVVAGEGLELSVEGAAPVRLTADDPPFAFPADASSSGRPLDRPVTVLNVMARRGRFTCVLRRLDVAAAATLGAAGRVTLLFCQSGSLLAAGSVLEAGDALFAAGRLDVSARRGPAAALVAIVTPA